jgi:hypothetical protein
MARHRLEQTNDVWAHRYFTPRNATTCLFHDSSRLPVFPSGRLVKEKKKGKKERKGPSQSMGALTRLYPHRADYADYV